MSSPAYGASDYCDASVNLLPSGPVWPREPGSVLVQTMGALAPTYARNGARALALLDESPAGDDLIELLPEWESTLGLPDPCSGADPTLELRQAHVRARLTYSGGQSVPYFLGLAQALGFAITITESTQSHFGQPFGNPFGGEDWASTWLVTLTGQAARPFFFGSGHFGDPFQSYGDQVLRCEFGRVQPAHTILQFTAEAA